MATYSPECAQVFNDIKLGRKHRWVIFKIQDFEVVVEKCGSRTDTYENLLSELPQANCRYALYDYEFRTEEEHSRSTSKLFFIVWNPRNSNDRDRVTYTQTLPGFKHTCPGVVNLNACEEEDLEEEFSGESR